MIATIYDAETGEFLWTINAPEKVIAAQTESVQGWVEGKWSSDTHHVVDDTPVLKTKRISSPGRIIEPLTKSQLIIGLFKEGIISEQEAILGVIPPSMLEAISSLSMENQAVARITWASMTLVDRLHPLVSLIFRGKTEGEIDDFFVIYGSLIYG